MSISSLDPLRRYLVERFPLWLFVPLGGFLVAVSLLGGRQTSSLALSAELLLTLSWLLQFRLWDDLQDLRFDRRKHPERVLARQPDVWLFDVLSRALFAINLVAVAWIVSVDSALGLFLPLNLGLFLWYRWSRRRPLSRLVHAHGVIAKYPAFVLILASGAESSAIPRLVFAITLVYLLFAVYELAHDRDLRCERGGRLILVIEASALVSVLLIPIFASLDPSLT